MSDRQEWEASRIAWIDVETDGFWDPERPPMLLEFAVVVTDRWLHEHGRYSAVISCPGEVLDRRRPGQTVIELHERSGLWADLRRPEICVPLEEAEAAAVSLVEACRDEGRPVIWGGCSPSALDRPLLRRCMPRFSSCMHYRTLDLSSVLLAVHSWSCADVVSEDTPHRALADVLHSLETARKLASLISSVSEVASARS